MYKPSTPMAVTVTHEIIAHRLVGPPPRHPPPHRLTTAPSILFGPGKNSTSSPLLTPRPGNNPAVSSSPRPDGVPGTLLSLLNSRSYPSSRLNSPAGMSLPLQASILAFFSPSSLFFFLLWITHTSATMATARMMAPTMPMTSAVPRPAEMPSKEEEMRPRGGSWGLVGGMVGVGFFCDVSVLGAEGWGWCFWVSWMDCRCGRECPDVSLSLSLSCF